MKISIDGRETIKVKRKIEIYIGEKKLTITPDRDEFIIINKFELDANSIIIEPCVVNEIRLK